MLCIHTISCLLFCKVPKRYAEMSGNVDKDLASPIGLPTLGR